MTPPEARQAAFQYERTHPNASLSMAFMQGYLYKENETPPIILDDAPPQYLGDFSPLFEEIWKLYDRKDNKQSAFKAWKKLTNFEHHLAYKHIPLFVKAHPDKKYRPMLATYLNQKRFNDEEIIDNGTQQPTDPAQQRLSAYATAIANVK